MAKKRNRGEFSEIQTAHLHLLVDEQRTSLQDENFKMKTLDDIKLCIQNVSLYNLE